MIFQIGTDPHRRRGVPRTEHEAAIRADLAELRCRVTHEYGSHGTAPEAAVDQVFILSYLYPGIEPSNPIDKDNAVKEPSRYGGCDSRPVRVRHFNLMIHLLGRSVVGGSERRLVPVVDLPGIDADAIAAEDRAQGVSDPRQSVFFITYRTKLLVQ